MKLVRSSQVYVSEKTQFYARILVKAKCNGTSADMTVDQLCDAELVDRWEHSYPQLVEAWEKNCQLCQDSRKAYEEAEKVIINALSPVSSLDNDQAHS